VSPAQLFELADRLGMTLELSRAFRHRTLEEATSLPTGQEGERPRLFLNSHPLEIPRSGELLEDLRAFRERHPDEPLVLEIHEAAVTDPEKFTALRSELEELGIGHAFDDFGAGEARLRELSEAAPELVKFDAHFARGVHEAPRRLEVARALVQMMHALDIDTLIEGVETEEEVEACRAVGFRYAQGYYFGRPQALADLES
jgi:EAL domain-containing protein (putative c-di-GMP-specific phosphodiesterase class I)